MAGILHLLHTIFRLSLLSGQFHFPHKNTAHGEYLQNNQGDDLVSGLKTPDSIEVLESISPSVYDQLCIIKNKLEKYFRDMQ